MIVACYMSCVSDSCRCNYLLGCKRGEFAKYENDDVAIHSSPPYFILHPFKSYIREPSPRVGQRVNVGGIVIGDVETCEITKKTGEFGK